VATEETVFLENKSRSLEVTEHGFHSTGASMQPLTRDLIGSRAETLPKENRKVLLKGTTESTITARQEVVISGTQNPPQAVQNCAEIFSEGGISRVGLHDL